MSPTAYTSPPPMVPTSKAGPAHSHSHSHSHNHTYSLDTQLLATPRTKGTNAAPIPPSRPLRHLDDLKLANPDIDPSMPISRVVDEGNRLIREAASYRDISHQIDLAFESYLKAFIISAKVIPVHREASAMVDRKELKAAYTRLQADVNKNYESFEQIKLMIIADNERSGVTPLHTRSVLSNNHSSSHSKRQPIAPSKLGHRREQSTPNSATNPSPLSQSEESPTGKQPPVVRPKPQNLIGKSIANSESSVDDLRDRFSRLRNNAPTQGITPKPQGPRSMPGSSSRPKITAITQLPQLPKLPDAIYSPARGTVSSEAAQLPSSTPRGLFTRTGSMSSNNGSYSPASASVPNSQLYPTSATSSTAHSQSVDVSQIQSATEHGTTAQSPRFKGPTPPVKKPIVVTLPAGNSVTPSQLASVMKTGIRVMIIDVRSREDFDSGHLMSQATICIEPDILMRDNLSAAQIEESLVVSPVSEEKIFEKRHEFDLVVYYDQSTVSVPQQGLVTDPNLKALQSLHRALLHLNCEKELKNPPRLLTGGVDAWIDHAGPFSLQESSTSKAEKRKPNPNFLSDGNADDSLIGHRRKSVRYIVNPLKSEDIQKWEETIQAEEETASSPTFIRSRDEFLRRFPEVLPDQEESMTSSTPPPARQPPIPPLPRKYAPVQPQESPMFIPPPQRPPPALPRPDLTGLSHKDDNDDSNANSRSSGRQSSSRQSSLGDGGLEVIGPHYTGLNNPSNWCYANSILQVLRASPGFSQEILLFNKTENAWPITQKDIEKAPPPRLMIKMMSNLFMWMHSGNFKAITAQTLLDYSKYLCQKAGFEQVFGNSNQQDVTEFVVFLTDQLHDETDRFRNLNSDYISAPISEIESSLKGAMNFWNTYCSRSQSIADKYFRGVTVEYTQCSHCKRTERSASVFFPLYLTQSCGPDAKVQDETLIDTMQSSFSRMYIDDRRCEKCNKSGCERWSELARLPPLLAVVLPRGESVGSTAVKLCNKITWDFNNFDVSRFCLPAAQRTGAGNTTPSDPGFAVPAQYECYGVIVHRGASVANSGHYYSYVRKMNDRSPYAWYKCNDSVVTSVTIGSGTSADQQNEVFKSGANAVPYVVFFKRKNFDFFSTS
ncbi:hypothetical protein CFIMG_001050RA [Ceratocystis fimbriata CBS 114723]|uniref:USP domain-containing protein n=1 Tax=Ceratocystis fimbriata CBS 114723 TaxID=1035309 RepID=A0A2C5XH93_9PEZI|nr:hypothetical protein CFIMG_001050RA [Ceratocystis fimbriata CBS 114723]